MRASALWRTFPWTNTLRHHRRAIERLRCEAEKRRHVGEHGPSQRDHHRAVFEKKWEAWHYQTAAIAGTDPASSQGIHGAGVSEVFRCLRSRRTGYVRHFLID